MLVITILVAGALLIGRLSLRRHAGDWPTAAVDTCAWLLIAVAGLVAAEFWPKNNLVLAVALLAGFLAATFLRSAIKG